MNIHFSSATVQSYENKNKLMDLFYNPIVIFENTTHEALEKFENVSWKIESKEIGTQEFEILAIQRPSLVDTEDRIFVEFKLTKKDVPFQYDNYSCKLIFSTTLDDEKIEYEVLGIVKTKWSKGLI